MQKLAYLILGMHRSGTSALTGVLAQLGVVMPKSPMPVSNDNPKGYFESIQFMMLNNELLQSAGSVWNDWRQISSEKLDALSFAEARQKIIHAVSDEFLSDGPIAIKDPRICRIAPAWISALSALNYNTLVIIPYRYPQDVARSLHARDGMNLNEGLLLWLRHVLDAEYFSRGLPRAFVLMDDLLSDWKSVIEDVAQDTGTPFLMQGSQVHETVPNFLDPQLKHFYRGQSSDAANSDLCSIADGVFESLRALAKKKSIESQHSYLDITRMHMGAAEGFFSSLVSDLEEKASTLLREAQESGLAREELVRHLELLKVAMIEQRSSGAERREQDLATQKAKYDVLIGSQITKYETDKSALIEVHAKKISTLNKQLDSERRARRTAIGERQTLVEEYESEIGALKGLLSAYRNADITSYLKWSFDKTKRP